MRTALPFLCGVVLAINAPSLRAGDDPEPLAGESSDLVRKLGDRDFRVREGAERELARRGAAALVEVKRGAADEDLEIRRRSQTLLAILEKSDVDRMLMPFMAGKEDDKTPLPAWAAVKKVMGDDGTSRFLYALLYKKDRVFLEAIEKDRKAAQSEFDGRIKKLMPVYTGGIAAARAKTYPMEEVASVLLMAATAQPPLDQTTSQKLMNILSQQGVQQSIGWSHAMRRLTEKWLGQKCDESPLGMQAARLATIYGCHDLIEKKFRPATEKLLESAAANPSDFNLFYRALNQARQYNMHDLINQKLRPALLVNVTKAAGAESIDFVKLSQLANMCQSVGGMEQDLKPALRPALTGMVKQQAEQIDEPSRMYSIVQLARQSANQDLVDDVLRPAMKSRLLRLNAQDKDLNRLQMHLQHAQLLGLQEEIESILKPAATAGIEATAAKSADANQLQQAIGVAQTFGLRETLRPLAQRLVDGIAESKSDVNRLMAIVQMARVADLPNLNEAFEQKIKPAARHALGSVKDQRLDQSTVQQAIHLAEQLQLKEGATFALKAAGTKTLPSYVRGQALVYVAKFGERDAIPTLEKLLDDTTDLGAASVNNTMIRAQVGDMALGALIHVSGQNIEDYKLPWPRAMRNAAAVAGARQVFAAPVYYGFDTDAARQAARKQWRDSQQKK